MAATLRSETTPTIFYFQAFIPQGGNSPEIHFPAFIHDITDNHSPSWSMNMDIGRADPKVKYESFNRSISVSFVTAALYNGEHFFYLDTLNYLTRQTRPTYKPGLGFNGVWTLMKIGNYIKEYGILTNVTLNVNNDSPWIDNVPIYINGSITLQVVGDKKPKYENTGYYGAKGYNAGKLVPSPQAITA